MNDRVKQRTLEDELASLKAYGLLDRVTDIHCGGVRVTLLPADEVPTKTSDASRVVDTATPAASVTTDAPPQEPEKQKSKA